VKRTGLLQLFLPAEKIQISFYKFLCLRYRAVYLSALLRDNSIGDDLESPSTPPPPAPKSPIASAFLFYVKKMLHANYTIAPTLHS
jgi:hypothetical protein